MRKLSFISYCFLVSTLILLSSCSANKNVYLPKEVEDTEVSSPSTYHYGEDSHLEVLAVSGGGHRAAFYSLGAILALDSIEVDQKGSSLLNDIDVVSSVSGGSYGIATYVTSYIEYKCRNNSVNPTAMAILKANRRRVYDLGSAWAGSAKDIRKWTEIYKVLFPTDWLDLLFVKIDTLERKFHSKLTTVNCDGLASLSIGDVNGDSANSGNNGQLAPPFRHLVNATNIDSGAVFTFSNYDLKRNNQTFFNQIRGIVDNSTSVRAIGQGASVPYAYAIAASSAFPPVVSDAILMLYAENGTDRFLRLTDGGLADDNGLDTARNYIQYWIEDAQNSDSSTIEQKALLISVDSLVDSNLGYSTSSQPGNRWDTLIMRNADLPRYLKKRSQKSGLRNSVGAQDTPNLLELASSGQSLFGTSVGFSRDENNPDFLAVKLSGSDTPSSDISTFANMGGLDLNEKLAGIAEGYFQFLNKLTQQDERDRLIKRAKHQAFELLCEGVFTGNDVRLGKDCSEVFENDREINICFHVDKVYASSGAIERFAIAKRQRPACHYSHIPLTQAKPELVSYVDIKERNYLVQLNTSQENFNNTYIKKASKLTSAAIESLKKDMVASLDRHTNLKTVLKNQVSAYHLKEITNLIESSQLNTEEKEAIKQIRIKLQNEAVRYQEHHEHAMQFLEVLGRLKNETFSSSYSSSPAKNTCEFELGPLAITVDVTDADIDATSADCEEIDIASIQARLFNFSIDAEQNKDSLKNVIFSMSRKLWSLLFEDSPNRTDSTDISEPLENRKIVFGLDSLIAQLGATCETIRSGKDTSILLKQNMMNDAVSSLKYDTTNLMALMANFDDYEKEISDNCSLKSELEGFKGSVENVNLADLDQIEKLVNQMSFVNNELNGAGDKESLMRLLEKRVEQFQAFSQSLPQVENIAFKYGQKLLEIDSEAMESMNEGERTSKQDVSSARISEVQAKIMQNSNLKHIRLAEMQGSLSYSIGDLLSGTGETVPPNETNESLITKYLCKLIKDTDDCSDILDTASGIQLKDTIVAYSKSFEDLENSHIEQSMIGGLTISEGYIYKAIEVEPYLDCFFAHHNLKPNIEDREQISLMEYYNLESTALNKELKEICGDLRKI